MMKRSLQSMTHWMVVVALGIMGLCVQAFAQPVGTLIARGGGTTIVHGGSGSAGGFVPVETILAFHAENKGGAVTGAFDCLALMPSSATGAGSGQFTVNVMYVTGTITGAEVHGDTATLTGTATITGLGEGSGVPFTALVRKGGPGATMVLTVETLSSPFNEILVEGSIQVGSDSSEKQH